MPLSDDLRDMPMEFQCPACSHPMVRPGSWLRTIGAFRCDSCGVSVRIGYAKKLSIFERYRRNSQSQKSYNGTDRDMRRALRGVPLKHPSADKSDSEMAGALLPGENNSETSAGQCGNFEGIATCLS
jgi:transcription elongation factor Elf1